MDNQTVNRLAMRKQDKNMGVMPRQFMALFVVTTVLLWGLLSTTGIEAQQNLLENPGFEGSYVSAGRFDFTFAPGWSGWYTNSPSTESWMNVDPIAYPHPGQFVRAGTFSQDMGRGGGTFTGAIYQVVPNVAEGTTLRFSADVFVENAPNNGARARIGIGSNVGGNPLAGTVQWSPWMRSTMSWQRLTVETTVPAGSVTVFIYGTQDWPNDPNRIYADQAELIAVGEGEVAGEVVPTVPTSTPLNIVPFVRPQGAQDDGSIVHRVQEGDTIVSIAVAYGVPASRIRELNGIQGQGSLIFIGQELIIREADPALAATATAAALITPTATSTVTPTDTTTTGNGGTGNIGGGVAQPTIAGNVAQATATTEPAVGGSVIFGTAQPTSDGATTANTAEPTQDTTTNTTTVTEVAAVSTQPAVMGTPLPAPVTPSNINSDPTTLEGGVCVLMFNDIDQNRIQGPDEGLIDGGILTLRDSRDRALDSYTTTGRNEPFCFRGLTPGEYAITAVAPSGSGLTTPERLTLRIQPGIQFQVRFGAAGGVPVAIVPTPDAVVADAAQPGAEEALTPDLSDISGLLLMGAAGVVLVSGLLMSFVARQF